MYITNRTKVKNLPEGIFILRCENYTSKKTYWLINKKLAEQTVFNNKYDFAHNTRKLKNLEGLYKAYEIDQQNYKLYNI